MDRAIDIGSRLELFVDRHLVDALQGTTFKLHPPQPAPLAQSPLRGIYTTVLRDGDRYRAWYREYDPTYSGEMHDGNPGEITCYAESSDGVEWNYPELNLCEVNGSTRNNAILAQTRPLSHNFAPFIDDNPAVSSDARYKALAGIHHDVDDLPGGLYAFASADGIRWRRLPGPVITHEDFAFDSQNVAFWSAVEGQYVCYFRTWNTSHGRLRSISRTTSPDFVQWSEPVAMDPNLAGEHLYTSQTTPYFRAPHIYLALPTRYRHDRGSSTDILFMATRAGSDRYERLFTEAFIRPGLDPERWDNRANYAACGIVPTGPAELSIYHARSGVRHTLRTDGFVSVNASHDRGELLTKPFTFDGRELVLNYSTSAAGSMAVEVQHADGRAVDGLTLEDAQPLVGDAIEQAVAWQGGADLASLAGQPVRLRVVMQEADLYSIRFR